MSTLTQTQEALPTGTWIGDNVHSHVGFEIGYAGGTFRGSFSPFEAQLVVDADGNAVLTGEAKADSVHVLDENLTAHLLSPDFFDAERAPVLSFATTEISRTGSDVRISGELTIKGESAPVELEGTAGEPGATPSGGQRFPLHLETTVDRRAFGIDWNMELPNGEQALANDVKLVADLYLVQG
ncbi:MAG TPA: YceI family protein [Gaiellaceae bacterium]|nr:YceI family protein [Gaiellaceae bacterium]